MKILLLTDRMNGGGAETHILQLAIQLKRHGHQVFVASNGGDYVALLKKNEISHKYFSFCTHRPLCLLQIRHKLKRWIDQEHFDVLHAHARIPAMLMRGLVKQGGCELVTVHARFKHHGIYRLLSYWGMHTIAVSEDLRASAANDFGVPYQRITVIPNGIDTTQFCQGHHPDCRQPYRVVFCGRMEQDCGIAAELLCQTALSLKVSFSALQIDLIGHGERLPALQKRANEINQLIGEETVHLCGWLENPAQGLQSGEFFVGVSRSAIEAALCGCAVLLCGNEGYFGQLTEENLCEAELSNFCGRGKEKPSAARLEQDLRTLLSDRENALRKADQVRQLLALRFDAEKTMLATLYLYRQYQSPACSLSLTLGGYFGCGNLGDDAILQGLISMLRKKGLASGITVLSGNPYRTSKELGVFCKHRFRPLSVLLAFSRSDAFLCGGGSLLQNSSSNRSLLYYLALLRIARVFSCTPMLISAGIGPIKGDFEMQKTKNTLDLLPYISLREQSSYALLDSIGIKREKLHRTGDLAFLLPPPPPSRGLFLLKSNGIDAKKPYLCVVIRQSDTAHHSTERIIGAALRIFCKRHEITPLFLEFDPVHDRKATAIVQAMVGGTVLPLGEPTDAVALMQHSVLTISMRLHGLLLATMAHTPCVGISHSTKEGKIKALVGETGQEYLPTEKLNAVALVDKMEWISEHREQFCAAFPACVEELQKKAEKDLENIMEVIYNKVEKQKQKKGEPT